ncbi:urease accessory protein UreD [Paenibacillus alginolyticus]|uniref:Urease accessory protein UreD n=1 Tax=Paenibacillus alginolyticus TaxID=59839 RepID=A0ABT4GAU5_9BACL|nr:urease accessory protein UreD [Paenibacillus alginolyticus]MCY9667874.1 urease accessory protein UreD [Paenibacillus alginolyticus]MCY9693313.1 urease accessory protein UreD [Paenibacillus alginolyticus]MEC0145087.1 urease accessory protein UreD [Paenibacillus alginolyticus]
MPSLTGEIQAEFAVRSGKTQLVHKYHASPLKIAKTFRYVNETLLHDANPTDQLGVYMMDCSPGLMSGDHYEINVRLGEGARVFLTNQSFTKVHPSEAGHGSTQRQTLHLEEDAMLEYMPEPLMLYKDACLAAEMDVHLATGSVLIFSDVCCPGRTQRGEIFQYSRYMNRMKVWYGKELIFYQNQRIEPKTMQLSAPGCWERETHLGNLYIFSDRLKQRHLEEVLGSLEKLEGVNVRIGASLTYKYGLIVTVMGRHAWELQLTLSKAWHDIRRSLLALTPLMVNK